METRRKCGSRRFPLFESGTDCRVPASEAAVLPDTSELRSESLLACVNLFRYILGIIQKASKNWVLPASDTRQKAYGFGSVGS